MAQAKAENDIECTLTVRKADLEKGLKDATFGIKKKTTGKFTLIHVAGKLILRGPVGEAIVPAEGYWPVNVTIPPLMAQNLVKVLPATDPLHLRFKEGRFYIENFSLAAQLA
jgi:hypothetical protein